MLANSLLGHIADTECNSIAVVTEANVYYLTAIPAKRLSWAKTLCKGVLTAVTTLVLLASLVPVLAASHLKAPALSHLETKLGVLVFTISYIESETV